MMKTRIILALLSLLAIFQTTQGQSTPVNRANFRLQALKTDQAVTIDGLLDEEIWSRAQKTGPFHRITPTDTGYAQAQTEVMVAYDQNNLYLIHVKFGFQSKIRELTYTKEVVDGLYTLIAGAIGENSVVKALQQLSDDCYLFNDFSLNFGF